MDVAEDEKKALKKLLLKKRHKRDWNLFGHAQKTREEKERFRDEQARLLDSYTGAGDTSRASDKPWMAKAHEARNRLNDKKRTSAERWNRFAGTEDSGGRGL